MSNNLKIILVIGIVSHIIVCESTACDLNLEEGGGGKKGQVVMKFKLAAIASILTAGAIGVSLPLWLATRIEFLKPENDMFLMIKAFAGGVILATGFLHILPDAFRTLTSPCLDYSPWNKFPFAGFFAMMASIGTLMVDTFATTMYKKKKKMHFKNKDLEEDGGDDVLHIHATHAAAAAAVPPPGHEYELNPSEKLKQQVVSQVLEVGIVVHSVIIGLSLGTSQSSATIKPLLAALCFHQFFEGLGLGGCISQAKFKSISTTIMAIFFSLTTPAGIGIGIGISRVYNKDSSTALLVEGIFNSASAGILIYMSLVDLLAADFDKPRMQNNVRLQLGAHISLLLGAACMSFMARWA